VAGGEAAERLRRSVFISPLACGQPARVKGSIWAKMKGSEAEACAQGRGARGQDGAGVG
jgi:hypothetical protein